jgi:hypothetical protein
MSSMRRLGLGLVLLVTVGVPATTWGAKPGAKKIIHLDAIKVEGRIQKPQAFYILQRSNLNFESLQLKTSFVPKIVESVGKPPF